MKKRYAGIIGAALVLCAIAGLVVFKAQAQPSSPAADKALQAYVGQQAQADHLEQSSTIADGDSAYMFRTVMDIPSQIISLDGDVSCTVRSGSRQSKVDLSIQSIGSAFLFNIHNISGQTTFAEAGTIDLGQLYNSELNKWYFASALTGFEGFTASQRFFMVKYLVPMQPAESSKFAGYLFTDKAVSYKLVNQDSGAYTLRVTTDLAKYKAALSRATGKPLTTEVSDTIDTLFDKADKVVSTVSLNADGKVIKESSQEHNICQELSARFIGTNPSSVKEKVTVQTTVQPQGSIRIEPITDYQDESSMQGRQTIYHAHTGKNL